MNINIIKKYIKLLEKEDINVFLIKNEIHVNNRELEYLFNTVKNNYEEIINGDKKLFQEIKNNINIDAYIKLEKKYIEYKKYLK